MLKVGLITCARLPEPDPDQALLLAALEQRGISGELLEWDDPAADPAGFDVGVFRSSWNYYEDLPRFLDWVDSADDVLRLANPSSVVRWNCHKRYLERLEQRGIPVVPTVWFSQGDSPKVREILSRKEWREVVVKPAVSASSYKTRRFRQDEVQPAQEFVASLSAERDFMVQKYLSSVEGAGEKALVWIGGELTHGIGKTARFSGGAEAVSESVPITDDEAAFAERVLREVGEDLLYARVDVMRDDDGSLLLSELELIEPSLYLVQHPPAVEKLVASIAAIVS